MTTSDGLLGFHLPEVDPDSEYFWDGVQIEELRLMSCRSCGSAAAIPMPACPYCASLDREVVVSSGFGTLYSWVVCHRAMEEMFAEDVPYVIADVMLEEGARIYGRILEGSETELHAGMPLEVTFVTMGRDSYRYWAFRLLNDGHN